jgi:hypothetical protein
MILRVLTNLLRLFAVNYVMLLIICHDLESLSSVRIFWQLDLSFVNFRQSWVVL